MYYLIYFLVLISLFLFILAVDVRIKGENYKTDWDDIKWFIPSLVLWPLMVVLLIFVTVVGFPVFWMGKLIEKLNIGAKFDKFLIKLFSKKGKESS